MEDGLIGGGGGGGGQPAKPAAEGGSGEASQGPEASQSQVNTNPSGVRPSFEAPMRKLTTGLLVTYKGINVRYFERKKAKQQAAASGGSSSAADYVMTPGQVLNGRYKVLELIGKGSFGQVVTAEDTKEGPSLGRKVAVKIIKATSVFRKQAKMEVKILELLNSKDPEDQWCIGECAPRPLRALRELLAARHL
jgi:hypothetical protein